MITTIHPEFFPRGSYLMSMFYNDAAVKALAAQMVSNQVEAHLDMISDAGPEEYKTFQEVADCVAGAKLDLQEYVDEMLADFKISLMKYVDAATIETTAVILKPGSEIDAEVTVKVE